MSRRDRSDQADQTAKADTGGRYWAKRSFPGPKWAYALRFVPGVGVLGDVVIFRARRRQRREQRRP